MLEILKRLVGESPVGPMARRIYRQWFPQQRVEVSDGNAEYDRSTIEVMRRVLQQNSCCIDVGAHTGSILREMLRIAPQGTHFAFEPLPDLAAYLRKTFSNVRVYEMALSDHTGTAKFVHVKNDPAYSGLQQRMYDRPDPVLVPIPVKVDKLDNIISPEQPVAFIKLDIEGGEFHALRGAIQTIRRSRPMIVFEAGVRSTGQYGVQAEEFYQLVTEELDCQLSTMQRWLAGQSPYKQEEFCQNWHNGPDYYFVGYPTVAARG